MPLSTGRKRSGDLVVLAFLRRVRGLRGELVAELYGAKAERLAPGFAILLTRPDWPEPKAFTVERTWVHGEELVLQFAGVVDRNGAEELRGAEVCIPEAERPPAPEGEFYFSDLVGCRVIDVAAGDVGEVVAWHDFGAAPVLEVRTPDGNEVLLPFAASFYREVDVPGRRIAMELPEGMLDLNRSK